MKILLVHNFYQQAGGEDNVFADEAALLAANGHEVLQFTVHNDSVSEIGPWAVSARTIWNRSMHQQIHELVRREQVEIAHFHNTFPLISPSALDAASKAGAAVVATLHNFRLICANGLLYRDGHVCESCIGRQVPLPAVIHACYRGSVAGSAVVAAMQTVHRLMDTWERVADALITPSVFAKGRLVAGGFTPERLTVKPNFVQSDPGIGSGGGGYATFVGRLSPEKGIHTLLAAWKKLGGEVPLRILGDGPLADTVREAAAADRSIIWLGRRASPEVMETMGQAALLVFPSVCYETFGKTIVEAMAKGTPVLASRHGAMAELIQQGRNGMLFEPGNADELAGAVRGLFADSALLARMRFAARRTFEESYTAEENYRQLMKIYHSARARRESSMDRPAAGDQPAESASGSCAIAGVSSKA